MGWPCMQQACANAAVHAAVMCSSSAKASGRLTTTPSPPVWLLPEILRENSPPPHASCNWLLLWKGRDATSCCAALPAGGGRRPRPMPPPMHPVPPGGHGMEAAASSWRLQATAGPLPGVAEKPRRLTSCRAAAAASGRQGAAAAADRCAARAPAAPAAIHGIDRAAALQQDGKSAREAPNPAEPSVDRAFSKAGSGWDALLDLLTRYGAVVRAVQAPRERRQGWAFRSVDLPPLPVFSTALSLGDCSDAEQRLIRARGECMRRRLVSGSGGSGHKRGPDRGLGQH